MAPAGKGPKVIGVGLACLDQLLLWEDASVPVVRNKILDHDVQGGGMTGTALVAVARLGGRAEFWGAVGDDWMGRMILQGLRREGVDASQVRVVKGGRGPLVVVCVDRPTGEKHFLHWVGFPARRGMLGSLKRLRGAGCLLVDGSQHASALRASRQARRLGIPVVADLGGIGPEAQSLLACVDYAIVGERCARRLGAGGDFRRPCRIIRALGARHVVVTLGARGLVCLADDRFLRMRAFPVEVLDTTGAGDVFHGAFCYGLVQGFPLERNLAFASATAALKCRRLGGRAGIPSRSEVLRFLKARGAW